MLATRLLSSFFGIVILAIVMLLPDLFFDIALSVIALMAIWEMYSAFKHKGLKPIEWAGYLSVVIIFSLRYINGYFDTNAFVFCSFIILFMMYLFVVIMNNKVSFIDVSVTLFSIFYIPFLFVFLSMTRHLTNGIIYVWFIFIGGWITDASAYFIGIYFGKKKLIPEVSPNKTIAGALGGILGCTLITTLFGLAINYYFKIDIMLYKYIILGILASISAQIGDLLASAIKRTTNVKDFGDIMPGHGGIIDRFDSILFVSPIVYFFLFYLK